MPIMINSMNKKKNVERADYQLNIHITYLSQSIDICILSNHAEIEHWQIIPMIQIYHTKYARDTLTRKATFMFMGIQFDLWPSNN
jgi:hypothetical protein